MGLNHPVDLGAWHASIERQRSPLRRLRNRLRSEGDAPAVLLLPGPGPVDAAPVEPAPVDVLIVVDSLSPSQVAALVAPMRHLDRSRVAVLTTPTAAAGLSGGAHPVPIGSPTELARALPDLRCVLAVGDYMALGALARVGAEALGAALLVAQHGIVTPFAPPLPSGCELLAWSEQDARFWVGGRSDVTWQSVGSQLLHEADRNRTDAMSPRSASDAITYLGQLHGHELPRRAMARAAGRFCRSTGATYRPHPSESDIASRLQHRLWKLQGIRFDTSATPVPELDGEVVSIFSTGILEATAAGIPAWVQFPDPPGWLREIWHRYGMTEHDPTGQHAPAPHPGRPDDGGEPAARIAAIIELRAGGRA